MDWLVVEGEVVTVMVSLMVMKKLTKDWTRDARRRGGCWA